MGSEMLEIKVWSSQPDIVTLIVMSGTRSLGMIKKVDNFDGHVYWHAFPDHGFRSGPFSSEDEAITYIINEENGADAAK